MKHTKPPARVILCDANECVWCDGDFSLCTAKDVNLSMQYQGEMGCTVICDTFVHESQ
jgi:hypothetical protein